MASWIAATCAGTSWPDQGRAAAYEDLFGRYAAVRSSALARPGGHARDGDRA